MGCFLGTGTGGLSFVELQPTVYPASRHDLLPGTFLQRRAVKIPAGQT